MGRKLQACEVAQTAVADARASGDRTTLLEALQAFSWSALRCERFDEGEQALTEVEALTGTSVFHRLRTLTRRAFLAKDPSVSIELYHRVRKEYRALGNRFYAHTAAHNLAEAYHARGQTEHAIEIAREIISDNRMTRGDTRHIGTLFNLAGYEAQVGNSEAAFEAGAKAIRLARPHARDGVAVAIAISHLALVRAQRSDFANAAVLAGYAQAAFERNGFMPEYTELRTCDRLDELLASGLAPAQRSKLASEGAALDPDAAIDLALESTGPGT
jgi:tetratricopeptide (TPR) repeat protein